MMIDYIFNLVIEKSPEISQSFYDLIEKLELNYPKEILSRLQKDKVIMFKTIIFVLYILENEHFDNILMRVKREELINLYYICSNQCTDNFVAYYKKSIINKYTDRS